MAFASDLAVLQDVKDWLSAGGKDIGTSEDQLLSSLVTRVSGMMYSYMSRQVIIPQQVTERYDGLGSSRILLRNWPALSVSSLVVDGSLRTAGTYPTETSSSPSAGWPPSGYLLSPWDGLVPGKPQSLDGYGSCLFPPGRQNVQVTYLCGYRVANEPATVASNAVQVMAPWGPWASDGGVVYADTGAALVAVAGSPGQGEYVAPTRAGSSELSPATYQFSAADAGVAVLITYGFVPAAVWGACVEWVAERYRYRQRIGQRSQTVAGQQTAAYDLSMIPPLVAAALDPYKCVVPFQMWY